MWYSIILQLFDRRHFFAKEMFAIAGSLTELPLRVPKCLTFVGA